MNGIVRAEGLDPEETTLWRVAASDSPDPPMASACSKTSRLLEWRAIPSTDESPVNPGSFK